MLPYRRATSENHGARGKVIAYHFSLQPSRFAQAGSLGLAVALAGLFLTTACKPSHQEAKDVKLAQSQLDLPTPSPQQQKVADAHLDWNMETLVGAYEKVGLKSPKWDSAARTALKHFAQVRAYGPNVEGFPTQIRNYTSMAVNAGCNDPLIKYLHGRFVLDASRKTPEQMAEIWEEIVNGLESSSYPEIRKFYVHAQAKEIYDHLKPLPPQWGDHIRIAQQHLVAALADKSIPPIEVDEAGHRFLSLIERVRADQKKQAYDEMAALLEKRWPKAALTYLLEGEFYVEYAWDGRSSKMADKVTPEQWKLFAERLATSEKLLLKGAALNPKEGRIPATMIKVVSGQGKGYPEMRQWFEKAMDADPNNYTACNNLLYFLLPRWYGSREMMLAFGRECATSEKWGGTVPLTLSDAHELYYRFDGPKDLSYWQQPEVWPDIRTAFDKFFARNPNATSWRHNYARYAWWCQQWDVLQEQLKLMGDNVNYEYFGGEAEFQKMADEAKKHAPAAAK